MTDAVKVSSGVQELINRLREDGVKKFLEGITTIEEIIRVTHG